MRDVDPKVEEAIDTLNMKDGPTRRKLLTGTGLVSATAAAAALLGIPKPAFTGSDKSNVPDMVSATNSAISSKANGIAIAVISTTAFTQPVKNAMNDGIPVVSYNADGEVGNPGTNRLAYIGQDLFVSGQELGKRIVAGMPNGGDAVGFIATPGTANIQPRIDGAKQAIKASGKNVNFTSVASGALPAQENTTINAYVLAHKSTLKGIFAVDAGSTQTVGQMIKKYN